MKTKLAVNLQRIEILVGNVDVVGDKVVVNDAEKMVILLEI